MAEQPDLRDGTPTDFAPQVPALVDGNRAVPRIEGLKLRTENGHALAWPHMHRFVASGFLVGLIPSRLWGSDNGAGTFGAALAALIALFLWHQPWWVHVAMFTLFLALSLWSARPFADDHADPGWIVIDEMAGTFVAVIGLSGWPWVVAVVVARLGDIFKVLPGVPQAEQLPGAVGITMDDVVAGLYGLAAGWFIYWLV